VRRAIHRLLHRLAHILGLNGGKVETWYDSDGTLMIGFRCAGCGRMQNVSHRRGAENNADDDN